MTNRASQLLEQVTARLEGRVIRCELNRVGEVTLEVAADSLIEVMSLLRDDPALQFDQLIDIAGIDYSTYGQGDDDALVDEDSFAEVASTAKLGAVYHLMSLPFNWRLRVHTAAPEALPMLDSVVDIWPAANWFEREAFDLFGIIFNGHPDLRRILTDYGFIGHPFRKDFPLVGHVEMFYDEEQRRVVYRPVDMENRVTVPRVVRDDHRYKEAGE